MRRGTRLGTVVWLGSLLLGSVTGCTVSIQPWTKTAPQPVSPQDSANINPYLAGAGGGLPPGGPPRPFPTPGGTEAMMHMIKQYHDADEHRKGLQNQVLQLDGKVRDREEGLRLALHEVDQTTKHMKRTRDEMKAWQAEMDDLRDRIRKLEENRASLKPLLDQIILQLDRDREPASLPSTIRFTK